MNGVINNIIIANAVSGRAEFQLDTLTYTWNSGTGELSKQDILTFPLLTSITKISSNIPVRLRLYRSIAAREIDLTRPPSIALERNSGIILEAILGGTSSSNQLELAPFCLVSGMTQVPTVVEKLFPDAATINLLISLVR